MPIDPDELMDDLEAEQEHIKELILMTKKQDRAVEELKQGLDDLRDEISEEPISSEQSAA